MLRIGIEIILEAKTNTRNSLDINRQILVIEAPRTFLTPISLIRFSAVKEASPKSPKQLIKIARTVKIPERLPILSIAVNFLACSSSVKTYVGSDLVDSISGATMVDTDVDKQSGTMVVSINAHDDGKIKLNLPSGINEAFMVIVDGEEWDDAYIDGNQIKVYFHAGAEKIEVIGNSSN